MSISHKYSKPRKLFPYTKPHAIIWQEKVKSKSMAKINCLNSKKNADYDKVWKTQSDGDDIKNK